MPPPPPPPPPPHWGHGNYWGGYGNWNRPWNRGWGYGRGGYIQPVVVQAQPQIVTVDRVVQAPAPPPQIVTVEKEVKDGSLTKDQEMGIIIGSTVGGGILIAVIVGLVVYSTRRSARF